MNDSREGSEIMKDCHGNIVRLGDIIRVLNISENTLSTLADDERPYIEKMIGNEYPIDDFPDPNRVSVSIEVEVKEGYWFCGGVYMASQEYELVKKSEG